MSIDLAKAVGHEQSDLPVKWNKRDLLLYAVGIGAKATDLQFVYENHPDFAAFPTYPAVLVLKGASEDVSNFGEKAGDPIPGLPRFDPNRIVHGSESLQIIKPIPLVSGDGWRLKRRISGVHENKTGVIVDTEVSLVDPSGDVYAKIFMATFNVAAKATGQKFSKVISSPPPSKAPPKSTPPTHTITETTSPESAIIYRLSGDFNPLHIDPKIGKFAGFGGPILHGLGTYGYAARAVLEAVGGGVGANLKYFSTRFTSPVKPGDQLETSIWELGPGPDGTVEVAFVTKDLTSGKIVLGGGTAYVKKVTKSKL
ncbi:peroxisomal dehydratase [Sistotremastrum niveocremeum HHB9708]|uniref:Peroxisomal dehydratase n=1 Tax=Sistotremastrum niveocremeum HHB9708 TaxID=1314777 RepID=A0A164U2E3_9AGAM|nr:peroxisomal dehydratase [Sistotremastrum niveocremeum HHB9708]